MDAIERELHQAAQTPVEELERIRVGRLGWDELTVEQKIERMRDIVKGIDRNAQGHWRRLEELGRQMRQHVYGLNGVILIPLDGKDPQAFGMVEAQARDGKAYF